MMVALRTELSPRLKAEFERDGYVALRGFFSLDEVAEINREIERYVEKVGPGLAPGEIMYEDKQRPETLKQIAHIAKHDAYFREFLSGPGTVALAAHLLGRPVVGKELEWFNKPPRDSRETPPHQDGYYFMLEPQEALTMWIALDDVDEENGCLRYLPGSHRAGLRVHLRSRILGFSQGIPDYGPEDESNEVAMRARPGDLLVHHSLTVHRAHPNRSADRHRRSLGLVYYSDRAVVDNERLRAYQRKLHEDWMKSRRI